MTTETCREPLSRSCPVDPSTTHLEGYFNNPGDLSFTVQGCQQYEMQSFEGPHSPFRASRERLSCQFDCPQQCTLHFVKFKANRMGVFHANTPNFKMNDLVIVQGDRGYDLGMIVKLNVTEPEARTLMTTLCMEEAAAKAANQNEPGSDIIDTISAAWLQIRERGVTIPKNYIHRLATPGEVAALRTRELEEVEAKKMCEMAIWRYQLEMSVVDVEYQWCVFNKRHRLILGTDGNCPFTLLLRAGWILLV